jgi:hypothetical protein
MYQYCMLGLDPICGWEFWEVMKYLFLERRICTTSIPLEFVFIWLLSFTVCVLDLWILRKG